MLVELVEPARNHTAGDYARLADRNAPRCRRSYKLSRMPAVVRQRPYALATGLGASASMCPMPQQQPSLAFFDNANSQA